MSDSYTKNIFVQCPEKLIKVAYLTFLKGGDISFGFSDKSKFALSGKLTYHPGNRVHVKQHGKYASEALTFFNNPFVSKEWLWCEAVSNPLFVIESGIARPERTRDDQLIVQATTAQHSVRVAIYKLPDNTEQDGVGKDAGIVEWCGTRLRVEVNLVEPQAAYMQPYVMN
jgi:hypothetical protein